MDPTRTIAAPPAAGTTAALPPAEPVHVAPVSGTDLQASDELRTLLRKRLRFFGALIFGLALFASVDGLLTFSAAAPRPTVLTLWAATAVLALTSAVLWSRVPLTFPQLRAAELILFGLPAAQMAYGMAFGMGDRDNLAEFGAALPLLIATTCPRTGSS
jgi:hypothetical protein